MDISANTFIDELAKCSGEDFIDDVRVKNKVCRFTFDIMLRCLMGDSSDIQTRNCFKSIFASKIREPRKLGRSMPIIVVKIWTQKHL